MKTFLALFVIVYVWAGFVYESETPLIVLDGKVVDEKTHQVVKPTRKNDGTCPNCRVYTEKKLASLPEPALGPK